MVEGTEPARLPSFEAVIFDLDGTLIDSEDRTDRAVGALLRARGLDPAGLPELARLHGTTWAHIGARLGEAFPTLADSALTAELQALFHAGLLADPPGLIPGAEGALAAAVAAFPTAIVTSSNRESLELALERLGVGASRLVTISADDVERSKPAPDGFLKAAHRLGVPAGRCLVFEDSRPGLLAARAAGMTAIAIARDRCGDERRALVDLAALVISDFTRLPPDFFGGTAPGSRP